MSIVSDHVSELASLVLIGDLVYSVIPKPNLTHREVQLFWRYHGHFPNDFAAALPSLIPPQEVFVSYDHLLNRLTTQEVSNEN
jgi:hypothetical protein